MDIIEQLIKSLQEAKEELAKNVKKDALKRLARDLAPHVNKLNINHVDDDHQQVSTPHPEGLVGYDIDYPEENREAVDRILEAHGHYNHPKAHGEDYKFQDGPNNMTRNGYGALQLHPEHAAHLVDSHGYSGVKPTGAAISPVQDPAIGSQNLHEGSATGEGEAKPAKWQGSDPRHDYKNSIYENQKGSQSQIRGATRAGNPIATSSDGNFGVKRSSVAATSGVSNRGYDRTFTGKPVKLAKNGQWALEQLAKNMNCAPGSQPNMTKEEMEKDSRDPALAPKQVKVKALQAQIDAGTYKPDSKKIADAMIKEELTCSENGQWKIMEKSVYNVGVSQAKLKGRESKPSGNFPHIDYDHNTSHEDNKKKFQAHFDSHKHPMNDTRLETYLNQQKAKKE